MKRTEVAKMEGFRLEIRPFARRPLPAGGELPPMPDLWIGRNASKSGIEVKNLRTGHAIMLYSEQIYSFDPGLVEPSFGSQRQGYLYLNGCVWMSRGNKCRFQRLELPTAEELFTAQLGYLMRQ